MTPEDRVRAIELALIQHLQPSQLTVQDNSQQHVGHTGNQQGGGHYSVSIVSPHFTGQSMIDRHKAVYQALGTLMTHDIHALQIQADAPDEQ